LCKGSESTSTPSMSKISAFGAFSGEVTGLLR
jgi:hypothetical protein